MEYVYKVFFGSPNIKYGPISPKDPWKKVITKDIFPGTASKTTKWTDLEDDQKVAYKVLYAIRIHHAFAVWADPRNEGVDITFLHGIHYMVGSQRVFPVIIELAKEESQHTIFGLTIWKTSVRNFFPDEDGWVINFRAKGPFEGTEYE
jgi:hypothetical protein